MFNKCLSGGEVNLDAAFVKFCGVNTPTEAGSSDQHDITEHGVEKRYAVAQCYVVF